jgi:hypothetical protein
VGDKKEIRGEEIFIDRKRHRFVSSPFCKGFNICLPNGPRFHFLVGVFEGFEGVELGRKKFL